MHTRFRSRFGALTWAVAVALASAPAAADDTKTPTVAVLDHHLAAFAAHDIDAIMTDYTDESMFITPQRVLHGKTEIRALFEGLVKEFSTSNVVVEIKQRHSVGPVAYIVWSAETPRNRYELASDTLYVEDDHILYQTFAAKISPK